MIALQVEYLTGPNAGRKLLVRETRISFGRSAERTLPVDLPFASREHGEFVYGNGQWLLVNLSNNSTLLNGKPVTKKPRPIKGPATVRIGEQDLFRVEPHAEDAASADASQPGEVQTDPAGPVKATQTSSKMKLWAGIGVFWLITFGLIAFAALNPEGDSPGIDAGSIPTVLSPEAIQTEITTPPKREPPDDRRAAQELTRAHELYALIDRRPDALYGSYDAYRQALSYSRGETLEDPQDQRRYHVLQQRLIQGVTKRYESANYLLRSRQYAKADQAFRDLREFYPDSTSQIFKDALKRSAAARDALEKKRRG